MESIRLESIVRGKQSRGQLKEKRRAGLVPGVIYGLGSEAKGIFVGAKELKKILQTSAGLNALIELELKGNGEQKKEIVMIKELQRDLLKKDELLHVDFLRISLEDKIEVRVPLNFVGEPQGVKEGGILGIQLREVAVKCLPTKIPERLDVAIQDLSMGHALSVADLQLPEGLELLEDPEENVVSIQAPDVIEEKEEEEELQGEETPEEGKEALQEEKEGE